MVKITKSNEKKIPEARFWESATFLKDNFAKDNLKRMKDGPSSSGQLAHSVHE